MHEPAPSPRYRVITTDCCSCEQCCGEAFETTAEDYTSLREALEAFRDPDIDAHECFEASCHPWAAGSWYSRAGSIWKDSPCGYPVAREVSFHLCGAVSFYSAGRVYRTLAREYCSRREQAHIIEEVRVTCDVYEWVRDSQPIRRLLQQHGWTPVIRDWDLRTSQSMVLATREVPMPWGMGTSQAILSHGDPTADPPTRRLWFEFRDMGRNVLEEAFCEVPYRVSWNKVNQEPILGAILRVNLWLYLDRKAGKWLNG